jgi:hypothetical protein
LRQAKPAKGGLARCSLKPFIGNLQVSNPV